MGTSGCALEAPGSEEGDTVGGDALDNEAANSAERAALAITVVVAARYSSIECFPHSGWVGEHQERFGQWSSGQRWTCVSIRGIEPSDTETVEEVSESIVDKMVAGRPAREEIQVMS